MILRIISTMNQTQLVYNLVLDHPHTKLSNATSIDLSDFEWHLVNTVPTDSSPLITLFNAMWQGVPKADQKNQPSVNHLQLSVSHLLDQTSIVHDHFSFLSGFKLTSVDGKKSEENVLLFRWFALDLSSQLLLDDAEMFAEYDGCFWLGIRERCVELEAA